MRNSKHNIDQEQGKSQEFDWPALKKALAFYNSERRVPFQHIGEAKVARLQKDVVSYFPHDANACAGDTLTVLQGRFGNDGYAFWFKLLEKLASTEGHYLDCRNPIKWQLLLAKIGVNEITGVEIMNLLVEMKAIDKDLWESKLIWCQKLVDNVSEGKGEC